MVTQKLSELRTCDSSCCRVNLLQCFEKIHVVNYSVKQYKTLHSQLEINALKEEHIQSQEIFYMKYETKHEI
jgi:hypothetical protein